MATITILKSELDELEAEIKEKNRLIEKLKIEAAMLEGVNLHNSIILLKTVRDNAKLLIDMYSHMPIPKGDSQGQKFKEEQIAALGDEAKAQQARLDLALFRAWSFCQNHKDAVQLLNMECKIDLPAMVTGAMAS